MKQFLTDNKLWPIAVDGNALTYIQALELMSHPVPHSAREQVQSVFLPGIVDYGKLHFGNGNK